VADRRQHALAEEPLLVAVAEFEGFPLAGRGPRAAPRPGPNAPSAREDVDFNRGIAPGVQDSRPCTAAILIFEPRSGGLGDAAGVRQESYHSRLPLTFDTAGVWGL